MIGVSNVGSDPILYSLWPQSNNRRMGGVSGDAVGLNADTVSIVGQEDESAGVYSGRDILSGGRDGSAASVGLDESDMQMVSDLEARDREVRSHEQAHAALLGRYAVGGPSYSYQMGPDGRAYAVGGSITADIGTEATPEATAMKARVLQRAAMGGGDPSSSDRSVALSAARMGIQAIA